MHINHRRFHNAEALTPIIAGLCSRGFELVTVGELITAGRGQLLAQERARRAREANSTADVLEATRVHAECSNDADRLR